MNVVVTRAARRDLAEAYDFITLDNPAAAGRARDQLVAVIRQVYHQARRPLEP